MTPEPVRLEFDLPFRDYLRALLCWYSREETENEYLRSARRQQFAQLLVIIPGTFFALFGALALYLVIRSGSFTNADILAPAIFSAVFAILYPFYTHRRSTLLRGIRSAMQTSVEQMADPAMCGMRVYTFDDNGLTSEGRYGVIRCEWEQFHTLEEVNGVIYLVCSYLFVIPRSAFEESSQADQFISLAKRRIETLGNGNAILSDFLRYESVLCSACGYERSETPERACPECGAVFGFEDMPAAAHRALSTQK